MHKLAVLIVGHRVTSRVFEAELFTLPRVWEELLKDCDYYGRLDAIKKCNEAHAWRKRGISITPCR